MTQWRSPGRDLLAGGAGCPCRVSEMAWLEAGSSCVGVEPHLCASGYLDIFCCQGGRPAQGRARTETHLSLLECHDRSRWAEAHAYRSPTEGTLPLPRHAPQAAKVGARNGLGPREHTTCVLKEVEHRNCRMRARTALIPRPKRKAYVSAE